MIYLANYYPDGTSKNHAAWRLSDEKTICGEEVSTFHQLFSYEPRVLCETCKNVIAEANDWGDDE